MADAQEPRRIEPGRQPADRLAQQVRLAPDVKLDIMVGGLDRVNLFDIQEIDSPSRLDHQPFKPLSRGQTVIEQPNQLAVELSALQARHCVVKSLQEALAV